MANIQEKYFTSLATKVESLYDWLSEQEFVFPEDTADSLTLTAGVANNSWAKTIAGTQDGGTSATVFTDSSENFYQLGVMVGDTITNTTETATGTITSITETTITCSGGISGGDNQWENGDAMTIASTNGWSAILDSGSNDFSDVSVLLCHTTEIQINEVNTADKDYLFEIGYGNENGVTTVGVVRFRIAAINTPYFRLFPIRGPHMDLSDYCYYRLKCETGGATARIVLKYWCHT